MRSACGKRIMLLCILAAMPGGLTQASPAQSNQPAGQTTPPKAAPKKPPQEPINPDETAGVRGSAPPLRVRVLMNGKVAENAHVVVKNTNGSLAASCDTNESGECQVELGPDRYAITATGSGRSAVVALAVSDATGSIVLKLKKPKSSAPQT